MHILPRHKIQIFEEKIHSWPICKGDPTVGAQAPSKVITTCRSQEVGLNVYQKTNHLQEHG